MKAIWRGFEVFNYMAWAVTSESPLSDNTVQPSLRLIHVVIDNNRSFKAIEESFKFKIKGSNMTNWSYMIFINE